MKPTFTLLAVTICLFATLMNGQTTSTFDNLTLAPDTQWYGSGPSSTFSSGNAIYPSPYDTAWMYWSGGWAYSNKTDSITDSSSYTQMFTAKAGSGYLSSNYSVGQNYAVVRLTGQALGGQVNGMWITNSNYAYNSMYFGDQFAKQFGGTSGNDTDWFKLTIKRYYMGSLQNDSVDFYLADYRFSNNAQDYIVRNWTYVDLTSLGNCDSLLFTLTSTDNGMWGMNTPAFFCMDELQTADSPMGIASVSGTSFTTYPNPVTDNVVISGENLAGSNLNIYNSAGQLVESETIMSNTELIELSKFTPGLYQFVITSEDGTQYNHTVVKQ